MKTLEIVLLPWELASQASYPIRKQVFIHEQGVPEELELDELDSLASHALAYQDGQCVGTARLVDLEDGNAQIGRMAVLANFRGQGVGRRLLEELVLAAKAEKFATLILHAQLTAIPFYEKLGFVAQGPIYDEAGIPHRNMMLILSRSYSLLTMSLPTNFTHAYRVCYTDTDAAGFIYHARYLDIFERSRAEWLAQKNLSPTKLITEFKILMPVRELQMEFHKPGRLDDILYIDQVIEYRSRAQITIKQTAKRNGAKPLEGMELIASASINIVCLDVDTLKPKAWPEWLFPSE